MASAFPSEAVVVLQNYQQWGPVDANDMATIPQATTDNVVEAFLAAGQGYTGLAVTANADALGVTVATGILYNLGGGYPLRSAEPIDLTPQINAIPDTVSSQIVLIVANGGTASVQESRTLEDASLKPANPSDLWPTVQQIITTRAVRACTPSIVPGTVAASNAQPPAYNPLLCLLATVTLNKTGVISVVQSTTAQITRLDQIAPVVAALSARADADELTITGLLSSVSTLTTALRLLQMTTQAQITALQNALTSLESRQITTTTSSVQTITDIFTDASGLTLQASNPGYAIGTGLTFPKSTVNGSQFFPLSQYASNVAVIGSRYLTAPYRSSTPRGNYGAGGSANYIPMQGLGYWNVPVQTEGFSVARTRYGAAYGAQPTAQLIASGDPAALFAINPGDLAYGPALTPWTNYAPELSHQNGYWHDLASRGFWGPRAAGTATGNTFAVDQVMQWDTSFMLLTWGLNISGIDGVDQSTPIRLLICEDLGGYADPNNVVMDITQPANYGAPFKMPYPLLIRGGRRYHFVPMTVGNFKVKTVDNAPGGQGGDSTDYDTALKVLMLRSANGAWQQNPTAQVAQVTYTSATFRTDLANPIEMNPLALSGGIDTLDILTPAVVPDGCDLRYGTVPNNSQTYTRFGAISTTDPTTNLLAGRPGQLRLFLELSYTQAVAPVIDLQASASGSVGAVTARQAGTLSAESAVRAPVDASNNPIAVTKITRQVTLTGFIPGGTHTYTEQLETGAGYTALTPPTTTGAPVTQADGTTLLTFSWTNISPAVTTFKLKYSGTTTDTTKVFTVSKAITTSTP